jgi:phosphatidylglycerophosphate synthase
MKAFILESSEIFVGGVSLRERSERMLHQLGVSAFHHASPQSLTLSADSVLILWGDRLLDPRIIQALINASGNVLAVDGRSPLDWVGAARIELSSPQKIEPSVFHSPDRMIEKLRSRCTALDLSRLDDYIPKLRRRVPLYWLPVKNSSDVRRAEQILIESAAKDPSDLMAIMHRPIENWVVSRLAHTSITPNQVTFFVNISAWVATSLFATGHLWEASILTLFVGLFDGFDGKLARLKCLTTNIGSLEHSFDLLFEFSWILALAYYLSQTEGTLPLLLAASTLALVGFYRSIYERYGQAAGRSLDVSSPFFEKVFRRVAARRNLLNVEILIFVLLGRPLWALWALLIHAGLTAIIYSLQAWKGLYYLDRDRA